MTNSEVIKTNEKGNDRLQVFVIALLAIQVVLSGIFLFRLTRLETLLSKNTSDSVSAPTVKVVEGVSAGDAPFIGSKDAPVTIVAFSDFECPYCAKVNPTLKKLLEKYAGTVRLVYRDFPLPIHQNAKNAAMAARCAGEQNRYWDMHDQLFAHQEKLDSDSLSQIAQEIGLAMGPYTECFSSKKYEKEIQKDFEDGTQYGVEGTPTFFVNGIMVTGAASLTEFETVIKQAQQK